MIVKLLIKDFPRHIKVAESRRTKYFEPGAKKPLPLKYRHPKYEWKLHTNKKQYLYNTETKERVIANPKVAGTPRFKTIAGQSIYNQTMHPFQRNKMMADIKTFFLAEFKKADLQPFKQKHFPLLISGELYMPYYEHNKNDWDVDNMQFPYVKAFHDALVTGGYIPDDHRGYIPEPLHFRYTPSKSYKMIITFQTDRRKIWDKIKRELFTSE